MGFVRIEYLNITGYSIMGKEKGITKNYYEIFIIKKNKNLHGGISSVVYQYSGDYVFNCFSDIVRM